MFAVGEIDNEWGGGHPFVDDGCARYRKMCSGAGVGNRHVYSNFYVRGVHQSVGAKVHRIGHLCPSRCSSWEWRLVLVDIEDGTILRSIACLDSDVIVIYILLCVLCGGRNSTNI